MTALVLQKCSASGKNQQDPRLGGKRSKGSVLRQPKRGGTTNTTLSRLGSSNPCADAGVQEDTHTELAKTRLSRERVWGTRTEQALEDGSQAAHSQDTHHGTTSWSDVSGQQFLISSRFYSQCALNLFYTVATWNWSERLVTCSQDIKTQRFQVFLGCSLQVHSVH